MQPTLFLQSIHLMRHKGWELPISEMCPFTTNGHDIDKLLEQESRLINLPNRKTEKAQFKHKKWLYVVSATRSFHID